MDNDTTLEPVAPISPVAPWVGGKKYLAKRLVPKIEAIPHRAYAEPFVGMGGVFFRRTQVPKIEVVNDLNREVHNLFRILQEHYVQFLDVLRWQITTRAEFERLMKVDPATLTDLQRAARFLYLQRTSFGGKVKGQTFGTCTTKGARFDVTKLQPLLEEAHQRLARVVVENLPYADFIRRYDRPETLFYLDPPYWGCEGYYGKELFGRDEFQRLADQLRGLAGRFVLSMNDVPEIREMFDWAEIEAVDVPYFVANARTTARQRKGELIITGP